MDQVTTVLLFVLVGFFAQMVDGALGMAYGVISSTFLLLLGVPPILASSSVHVSKIFTNGVSGLSHLRFGNVDKVLFRKLAISGIVGGIAGAATLSLLPEGTTKPFVAIYLMVMGLIILRKVLKPAVQREVTTHILPLGAAGGFFDAIGGGGWGPIVTSTLLARGKNPRLSIGSVNLAEFFVALAISLTLFLNTITQTLQWQIIVGLVIGGALAAPLSAYVSGRIPSRILMSGVGILIIGLSIVNFV